MWVLKKDFQKVNFQKWISKSEFPKVKFQEWISKSKFWKVKSEKWFSKSEFPKENFQKWIQSVFIINKLNSQVNYLISNFKRKSGVNSKPLIKNKSFSLPYHNK